MTTATIAANRPAGLARAHRRGNSGGLAPLTRSYVDRRGGTSRLRRGVAMLEFALILPIFLFMLVFAFDMGHLILMSGAVQDATFTAARTGAQLGGAGYTADGNLTCSNGSRCRQTETWNALANAVSEIPTTATLGDRTSLQMTVVSGAKCTLGGNDHVVVHSSYRVRLITPGLGSLLSMISTRGDGSAAPDMWTIGATAVARCEVVRP